MKKVNNKLLYTAFRLNLFFFTALIAISLASCNRRLDLQPVGTVSQGEFYSTADDAMAAVTACYNTLLRIASQGTWNVSGYELYGDIQCSDVEPHPDIVDYQQIQQCTVTPSNPTIQAEWAVIYAGIYRANLVLEKVPAIEMDATLKARLLGEAYFIRAWWNFRLAKIFGSGPLVTQSLKVEELYVKKSSRQEIFDQVEKDLLEAIKVLPVKYDDVNAGRATIGAARTYLAELYMWEKQWTKAKDQLDEVLGYGYKLVDSYASLFDGTNDNSTESIFEIQYTAGTGKDLGNFNTVLSAPNGEGFVPGGGWGWTRPTPDIVSEFETSPKEDPRLRYSIFRKGDVFEGKVFHDVVNGTGLAIRKWCISAAGGAETSWPNQTSCNYILYRYADVLLLYAEVMNELGQPSVAIPYINKVRERPSVAMSDLPLTLTKEQVTEAIRHERRVEFCFEGKTGYDMRRWGIIGAFLRSADRWQNNTILNPQWGGQFFKFKDGVNEVLPIPQLEIDRSRGSLEQNKGF